MGDKASYRLHQPRRRQLAIDNKQ